MQKMSRILLRCVGKISGNSLFRVCEIRFQTIHDYGILVNCSVNEAALYELEKQRWGYLGFFTAKKLRQYEIFTSSQETRLSCEFYIYYLIKFLTGIISRLCAFKWWGEQLQTDQG